MRCTFSTHPTLLALRCTAMRCVGRHSTFSAVAAASESGFGTATAAPGGRGACGRGRVSGGAGA